MTRARLIGIDRYPDPANELHGCKNDVQTMRAFLEGLQTVQVLQPLCDAAADVASIDAALVRDIAALGDGDQLLVHFSGHGSRLYFAGALRAAACPVNFMEGDRVSAIIDLDIGNALAALRPLARVTIFADCCFSGGLQQDFVELLPLADVPTVRVRRFVSKPGRAGGRVRAPAPARTFDDVIGDHDVVLLSASGFAQRSGETSFGNAVEGIFTHFLVQHLAAYVNIDEPATATRDAVCVAVAAFPQRAELHGRRLSFDKPLIQR